MTLDDLLVNISSTEVENSKLYFITRILSDGVKNTSKVMDKYLFKAYQIDIDDDIRKYLYTTTQDTLKYIINKQFEIIDYDVISDDTDHLFTYSMTNRVLSFSDIVINQLTSIPPKVMSISSILTNKEQLWAYCVGFNNVELADWIYTFRKIQPSKVAINEKKSLRAYFSTKSQKLELLKGETLTLDKQIDCVFYDEIFYIIKKGNFEQIIGLQEEFKEEAIRVVEKMEETNMIVGLELIKDKIETNPAIHKKLVRISKIDNYRSITPQVIKKMSKVCKKYGDILNIKDNKLSIEADKDIDVILKMLADYYKTGDVTGKAYGTFAGKALISN